MNINALYIMAFIFEIWGVIFLVWGALHQEWLITQERKIGRFLRQKAVKIKTLVQRKAVQK